MKLLGYIAHNSVVVRVFGWLLGHCYAGAKAF